MWFNMWASLWLVELVEPWQHNGFLNRREYSEEALMSDETEAVSEADCVLCRRLDPAERTATRADLLEIPLRAIDNICEQCLGTFWINLQSSFPRTEEERPAKASRTFARMISVNDYASGLRLLSVRLDNSSMS
jgi:hypothetical protein